MDTNDNFKVFYGLTLALCVLILVVALGASLYADQEENIDSVYSTQSYSESFVGLYGEVESLTIEAYDTPTVCFSKGSG